MRHLFKPTDRLMHAYFDQEAMEEFVTRHPDYHEIYLLQFSTVILSMSPSQGMYGRDGNRLKWEGIDTPQQTTIVKFVLYLGASLAILTYSWQHRYLATVQI